MARIVLLLPIIEILFVGLLAAYERALMGHCELEDDIELCCLMAAIHDAKTIFEMDLSCDISSLESMRQSNSERIYQCARALGLRHGWKSAEDEISKELIEIPFARLLEKPQPDLSDVIPDGLRVLEFESDPPARGTQKALRDWLRSRISEGIEHGFRLGILDAVDSAVLTQEKRLPRGMVLSDVHRLRLLWIMQWSETSKQRKSDSRSPRP